MATTERRQFRNVPRERVRRVAEVIPRGRLGSATQGMAWHGLARRGRRGLAWSGMAERGTVWLGAGHEAGENFSPAFFWSRQRSKFSDVSDYLFRKARLKFFSLPAIRTASYRWEY
jgi:hypothetical protein